MSASLSPPSRIFVTDLLTAFQEQVEPAYRDCLTAQTNLYDVSVSCLTQSSVLGANIDLGNNPGTVTGSSLPLEVAAVCARQSLLKGQHGRGRFSMPAVPVQFTTPSSNPNVLNAVGIVAYQVVCTSLNLPLTGGIIGTVKPVIFTVPNPLDPVNVRAALVQFQYPKNYLGTVRRRKPFRGI